MRIRKGLGPTKKLSESFLARQGIVLLPDDEARAESSAEIWNCPLMTPGPAITSFAGFLLISPISRRFR